jgi:hypothetical protein
MKNATLIWVVLAVVVTWWLAKAHSRVQQKRGARAGKLLMFSGGKSSTVRDDLPVPQGEELPTAI